MRAPGCARRFGKEKKTLDPPPTPIPQKKRDVPLVLGTGEEREKKRVVVRRRRKATAKKKTEKNSVPLNAKFFFRNQRAEMITNNIFYLISWVANLESERIVWEKPKKELDFFLVLVVPPMRQPE